MTHSAFSTDTCAVVTSKQEVEEAAAGCNHGDEAKKTTRFSWIEQKEDRLTALPALTKATLFKKAKRGGAP